MNRLYKYLYHLNKILLRRCKFKIDRVDEIPVKFAEIKILTVWIFYLKKKSLRSYLVLIYTLGAFVSNFVAIRQIAVESLHINTLLTDVNSFIYFLLQMAVLKTFSFPIKCTLNFLFFRIFKTHIRRYIYIYK